jgi:S-formylglutathione hydrolase FrmB
LRRRGLIAIVGALVACVAAGAGLIALLDPDDGGAKRPGGLELVNANKVNSRTIDFTFATPALATPTRVRVLLPAGYRKSKARYPVLYLLPGAGQNYGTWTNEGEVAALTRRARLIVVMPDGGAAGFYSDWFNGGAGGQPMWETYHVGQLIPWVDSRFRTRTKRSGRAVAGVSMGGFGALSYTARHPELFSAAASFSGTVDVTDPSYVPVAEAAARTADGEPAIWGPYASEEQRWREHNPLDLADRLSGARVYLFTGNGAAGGPYGGGPDQIEAMIHGMNVRLHQRLTGLGIRHLWNDYGPGAHSMAYARASLAATLPSLERLLIKR